MKKDKNKGFMLTETLIVSTMLITVLLLMYVQFKNVIRSYDQSFTYNTINGMYGLYNVKKYIEQENFDIMASRLITDEYVDITECSSIYFKVPSYCNQLFESLDIKKIYLAKENIENLKEKNNFNTDMNDFLKTIKHGSGGGYRLIAQFKDNTFASLKALTGSKYESIITGSCNSNVKTQFTIDHKLDTTNVDLIEPTIKKVGCGANINVADYAIKNDSCIYPHTLSKNNILTVLDESANTSTITYKKFESTLTINYYEVNTTTSVAPTTTVTVTCVNKINAEDYKKLITNRQYINSSHDTITMTKNNETINMYYTVLGGSIYD
ncbi:MAG: hypothetical protein RR708_00610 [Bacilli bacterium]